MSRRLPIAVSCGFLFLHSVGVLAAEAQAQPAKIVSVRENATVRSGGEKSPAAVSRPVESGEELETDTAGRLSILLPNQMLLKVAEQTQFLYSGSSAGGVSGKLNFGRVWLRGQKQEQPFEVTTPTATAAIRGTEWYMEVAANGTTKVGVLDGVVEVSNSFGAVELSSREQALVEPGKPPVKLAYVTPPNAVNWTLNYFGLWDRADFGRADPAVAPLLEQIVTSYYASDLPRAASSLQTAEKTGKSSAAVEAAHAFLLMVSGKSEQAAEWFRKASRSDAGWALPLAHLSLISLVESDLKAADELAARAVQLQPDSAVAHLARAYALKGLLKLDDAYPEAVQATDLSPDFQEALLIAAQIAIEMGRLADAQEYLRRAHDDRPPLGRKRTLEGFLDLRLNRTQDAAERFAEATKLEPDSADGWLGLGIALFKQNREGEAIDAITRATLIAPQVSDYQSYLAKAYAELGRNNEARQVLMRAKRLDPKDPTPYLYDALIHQAEFEPGQAFLSLEEARKRNANRAVFRSRYLLDQDQSVVTSNLAQVYHEIGFDHTATQEAARALDIDPTNQAAHRRQFFALQFDPRSYAQAAASERLLNNLFLPPTRSGVVLDEDLLSPYQSIFDRPGVDPVLRGNAAYSDSESQTARSAGGSALLAGQLELPFAYSLEIAGDGSRTSALHTQLEPRLVSEDRDDDAITGRGFAKWQVSPSFEVYTDVRHSNSDRSREGAQLLEEKMKSMRRGRNTTPPSSPEGSSSSSNQPPQSSGNGGTGGTGMGTPPPPPPPPSSQEPQGTFDGEMADSPPRPMGGMPPGELPPPQMVAPEQPGMEPPSMSQEAAYIKDHTDSDLYDTSIGLHGKMTPSTDALAHFSYHHSDDTLKTKRFVATDELHDTMDSSFDYWISQGALWQRAGDHFFQLGGRYFSQDVTVDTSEEETAGMPQSSRDGNDANVQSGFLVDQFTGIPNVTVTLGANVDRLNLKRLDDRESTSTKFGPSIGAVWEVIPSTYLRAAAIHNAAGDRNERLQQTFIAGFPWQRLTLIEPYSSEQFFNLEYETYVLAWDTHLQDPVLYLGGEMEHDHERTQSFAEDGSDTLNLALNDAERARVYVETLFTPEWAGNVTYRFDSFEYPDKTLRNAVGVETSYFSPWKLVFRLGAEYVNLQTAAVSTDTDQGDQKEVIFRPAVEGYPFNNRLRVNVQAPFSNNGDYEFRADFIWYLNH
ncbi:MAG: FecR domain-containing protein [Bdellovibrionota bacterium]